MQIDKTNTARQN